MLGLACPTRCETALKLAPAARPHLAALLWWRLDGIGHIPRHEPQRDGHVRRLLEPKMAQLDRVRAAPCGELVAVELLELLRGQPLHRHSAQCRDDMPVDGVSVPLKRTSTDMVLGIRLQPVPQQLGHRLPRAVDRRALCNLGPLRRLEGHGLAPD
jgi:hypothetical protein